MGPSHQLTRTRTSTQLLAALADESDPAAWDPIVARYRPMLVGFGVRMSLDRETAEDAAQSTLAALFDGFRSGRYRRDRGRLRDWLWGIARVQVAASRARLARGRHAGAPDGPTDLTDADKAVFDDEWRRSVLAAGLEELRASVEERTYLAFELFALRGVPAEEVARDLGLTANAVFGAKRRVLRRLRELLPTLEDAW